MGNFRTTNLGVVMAKSGLRPAESLLNNRSRRHVLRLMSLPKGNQAKSLPGGNTAMHGTAYGPFQRVLRPGGRDLPAGGRTNGTRCERLHRRRRVGGAGGAESGLTARVGMKIVRVKGRLAGYPDTLRHARSHDISTTCPKATKFRVTQYSASRNLHSMYQKIPLSTEPSG